MTTNDDKNWAMLCHISAFGGWVFPFGNVIAPLIIWILKKDEMEIVDQQGKEVLNFQITISIALFISAMLMFVFIGFILLPIVALTSITCTILGIIKTSEGKLYHYPFSIKFVK